MTFACRILLLSAGLIRFDAVSGLVGFHQPRKHSLVAADRCTSRSSVHSSATDTNEASSAEHTSATLSLFSPCKINLFLRIIRKREDGFHDLASLFQAIGFGDTLELTPLAESADSDEFSCNMAGVPVDSSNLVIRALELMREKTGTRMFFKTNLIKQVPAQAGLGGGSANAATAMWGANELMGRPASLDEVRIFPIFGVVILGVYSLDRKVRIGPDVSSFCTLHRWSSGPVTWVVISPFFSVEGPPTARVEEKSCRPLTHRCRQEPKCALSSQILDSRRRPFSRQWNTTD